MNSYVVKLRCEEQGETFYQLKQTVLCSVGLANRIVSPPILPLTILIGSAIQVSTGILVLPILVDTEERVVGCLEADIGVVGHAC